MHIFPYIDELIPRNITQINNNELILGKQNQTRLAEIGIYFIIEYYRKQDSSW